MLASSKVIEFDSDITDYFEKNYFQQLEIMFLAAPLYSFVGILTLSGIFQWMFRKLAFVDYNLKFEKGKDVQVTQIIRKFCKFLPMKQRSLDLWYLFESPGSAFIFWDQIKLQAITFSLTTGDYTIRMDSSLASTNLLSQKSFQFCFLSVDDYDDLVIGLVISYFIETFCNQTNKPRAETSKLLSLLTKSFQVPDWSNTFKSLVPFQKVMIILLLSCIHSWPLLVGSTIMNQMLEEEISCILSLAKLIQQKTKQVSMIVVGEPNPTFLRYLAIQEDSIVSQDKDTPIISSLLGFEVSLPLAGSSRLSIPSEFNSFSEGDYQFFTVAEVYYRPQCR